MKRMLIVIALLSGMRMFGAAGGFLPTLDDELKFNRLRLKQRQGGKNIDALTPAERSWLDAYIQESHDFIPFEEYYKAGRLTAQERSKFEQLRELKAQLYNR